MRRLRVGVLTGVVLLAVTGCPTPVDRSAERTTAAPSTVGAPLPGRPTDASTDLPGYEGPPPGAPPSRGPLTTVRAAVDLTPGEPGVFSRATFAVAAPDGGAYVVLRPAPEPGPPHRLVTVSGPAGGYAVTASVPMPAADDIWGVHLLRDGTVAVTGGIFPPEPGTVPGPGFTVVDPARGVVRRHIVARYEAGSGPTLGRSALSADGRTLYLFVSDDLADRVRERILEVDVATGELLTWRELAEDVGKASLHPIGIDVAVLAARPGGGVTLAFDSDPTESGEGPIPTLLTFDADLAPVGDPVLATSLAEEADTQAATASVDGTVFLLVEVPYGSWILAVPDGGGAGPVLVESRERIYNDALLVEPAQVWALTHIQEGVQAVDLTTGELGPPVDLGCPPRQEVRGFFPGTGGAGALVLGTCDVPRAGTSMLWILGP